MGMFLGDHKISRFFFGGGGGWGVCLIFLFFRVWGWVKQWIHEEKLRVAPIHDTYSVLSF